MRARSAAALVGAISLSLVGCTSGDDERSGGAGGDVAVPAPVALAIDEAVVSTEDPVEVGVVLTLRSRPGEGAERRLDAAGAQVAAYRLSAGGAEVSLVAVDDGGTVEGARGAVAGLVEEGVAGIVVASEGRHLGAALEDASEAGMPVLLPYDAPRRLPEGVWSTAPSSSAVDARLLASLRAEGHESPFVVTGDGVRLDGVGSADAATYRPGRASRIVADVVRAVDSGAADSVVLGAAAPSLADLVTRLAGRDPDLPVYLSPQAVSASFDRALLEQAGTLLSGLRTVGPDVGDTATLDAGPGGNSAAAYFAALRLAAADSELQDLVGSGPFSEVAGDADTASHDAVVALVRAVEAAGSTEPGDVRSALEGLTVDGSGGLAGPALDFSDQQALPDEAVVPLVATTQDPGVRPVVQGAARLFWFAAGGEAAQG